MVTKELIDYINYQLDHGESWEATKRDLAASGWGISALDEAYAQIMAKKNEAISANVPSPMIEVPPKTDAIEARSEPVKINPVQPQDLISNTPKASISLEPKKEAQRIQSGINVPGLPKKGTEQPKKNGLVFLIITVIILLLFLAGGTFAYFNYFNSESVIAKIFQNSQVVDSGEFNGSLEFSYSPSSQFQQELNTNVNKLDGKIDIGGKYNFKDSSNVKMDLSLKIDAKNQNDEKYILNSDIKAIDNDAYFKINDVIIPQQYEQFIAGFRSNIIAKWLKAGLSNRGPEDNLSFHLNEAKEKIKENSATLNTKLAKAIILEFKGFEGCNSSLCIKYNIKYNQSKMRELLVEIAKEGGTTDEELSSTKIDKTIEIIKNTQAEILVGSSDFRVHKISFTINDEDNYGKKTLKGTFSSYNENSDIEIKNVDDSTSLENLYQQFMGSNADTQKDETIRSDIWKIKYAAENYKLIKGTYIDFTQGDEIVSIIKEINEVGGTPMAVYSSKDKYCVSKDLVSDSNNHYCADSTQYIGEGICSKDMVCTHDYDSTPSNNPTPSDNPTNPETPSIEPTKPEQPETPAPSEKSEVETLIDALADSLQKHNIEKSTYLGYISSKDGIAAVKKINELEGDPLVVATSKAQFCIMKKNNEETYCVDSIGYSGSSNKCSSKNISCK